MASKQGHTVDALAQRGEEGRSNRRNAVGSRTQALIRGYPNGATQWESCSTTSQEEQTQGSETSQYLEEKTSIEIPVVVASEPGEA
jgi:hypothetical protein